LQDLPPVSLDNGRTAQRTHEAHLPAVIFDLSDADLGFHGPHIGRGGYQFPEKSTD
jgi:hypothetical protein